MKLLKWYQELMKALGLVYDQDGFVSRLEDGKPEPLTIKDQRLVLPYDVQLENPNWEGRIAFNPLYESLARKESPVHEAIRTQLNLRLNTIFGMMNARLVKISGDTGMHATLTADQTEYLDYVKKVDKHTFDNYIKLIDAFPGDRAFVNIYSRPGGMVKGEKFSRAAIVSFPIYEALASAEDGTIKTPTKNVRLRPKDIDTFMRILEYVIPNIKEKHHYDVGSVSNMAPTLESLLAAAAPIFRCLNDQLDLFHDRIAEADELKTELAWVDELDRIGQLYTEAKRLGMMNGNEGLPSSINTPTSSAAPVAAAPAAPAPTKQVTMINPITGEPVKVAEPAAPASTFTAPNAAPAPAQTSWAQPTMFTGTAQPFRAAPSTVTANGKADMNAILASNPALAAQFGAPAQSFHGHAGVSQQERVPGWATGGGMSSGFTSGFSTPRRNF